MKPINFFLIILLCMFTTPVWGEPIGEENPPAAPGILEVPRSTLTGLNNFNEGVLFLLQRYATLEAQIRARRSGRMENQAFAIGTASVVPGAGQMINGDYQEGGLLLLADSIAGINANQLLFSKHKPCHPEWEWGYYSASILRNGVMLYATLHAANACYRAHQDSSRAMWTGAASVVPGVGQVLNGNWWEAAGFFAAYAASTVWYTDMENHFYAHPGKKPVEASEKNTIWSVAILPTGIAIRADW